MKSLSFKLLAVLFSALIFSSVSLQAQTVRYWSATGTANGGTGTWNTTDARFGPNGGPFTVVWDNTANASDTAQFSGTAGTVTLSGITAVRRLNVTVSGYSIGAGSVTSDQAANSFWISSQQAGTATVDTSATFSVASTANIRIRTEHSSSGASTAVLNVGGDYQFSNATGTKRLDLDSINDTVTHTINFSGALLSNSLDTRLRIGNAAGAGSTFNLSGGSTYAGSTEIVRGTVNASNSSAFGTGPVNLGQGASPAGTTLRVNVAGARDFSNVFQTANGAGALNAVLGKAAGDATSSTLSGNINLNSDTTSMVFDIADSGANVTLSALVSDGAGTRGFTKTGAGTLALTRSTGNAYDGVTTISNGTVLVNNTSGSGLGTGHVNLVAGTLRIGDGGGNGAITGNITNGGAVIFNRTGTATYAGTISGTGTLAKQAAGTVTLTGDNGYTGATTVSGGTLTLDTASGSSAGSTASVTVGSGATLLVARSNQVNDDAAVTLSGGTIQRGAGVSETMGDLNLTTGSFIDFGSGAAGNITFGTYSPVSKLTITGFTVGNSLVFGSDISSFIAASSAGPYDGTYFSFDQGFTTNLSGSTFTITAIPEPSTLLAAAALGGLLAWSAVRRRRKVQP